MNTVRIMGFSVSRDVLINLTLILAALTLFVVANPVFAAGGLENLNKSTNALKEALSWLKVFVGVASIFYIVYLVGMAIAEKKAWSDVAMGIGYCAIAGGAAMAGEWATTLWD